MLEGRDFVAGVGLTEFTLTLFDAPTSGTELKRRPTPELATLLGLAGFLARPTLGLDDFVAGAGAGAASLTYVMVLGRINMPLPGAQSKYLTP